MDNFLRHAGYALILLSAFGPLAYCGAAISKHENQVKISCIESGGQTFGAGCRREKGNE